VGEQLCRLENLGDEHGTLTSGGRRQKMEVLPHSSANRAGNADVVLKTGQPAFDCQRYEFRHYCSALYPESAVVAKLEVAGCIADDKSPTSLITNQDVGTESEQEVLDVEVPCCTNSPCQIIS
jgi:hypothetical protein